MKNSAQCPKCDGRDIYEITGSTMNMYQRIPLNVLSTSNATLDRYICANCGYTEEFIQLDSKFHRWARKNSNKRAQSNDDFV